MVYIIRTHLLSCAGSPRQHGSKWEFLCSNKTSLKEESAHFGSRLNFLKSYTKSYFYCLVKDISQQFYSPAWALGFPVQEQLHYYVQCFHFSYLESTCPHFPVLPRSFSHLPVANYITTSQKGNWFCFLNLPLPSESSRPSCSEFEPETQLR